MSNLHTLAVILVVFWAIGFSPLVPVESYILLVIAIIAILLRLIQGKDYKISILVKN
jgi:hypothetical protein